MTSREAVRSFKPRVVRCVHEGQVFHVRGLSGTGRAQYLAIAKAEDEFILHKVVALGLCEEDGSLVYNVDNKSDLEELMAIDGEALQAIALKVYEISGLTKKAVEDAPKN